MRTGATVITLSLLLGACSGTDDGTFQGYIEGTYVYVAAESAGRLVERPVIAGSIAERGAVVARLDAAEETESVIAAEARLAQAEAQLANLRSGERPEEISVIIAELNEARASFKAADDNYKRQLVLLEREVVSQAAVDDAKADRDVAEAKVESVQRQLEVAQLPARVDEILAAESNVAAEKAVLAQARIALDRRTVIAPNDGYIEETFYEPGELVEIGQPIVSLLPEINKKVRFFVPEERLSGVMLGQAVAVACDNCPSDLTAVIDFIASEAEYTPPVIFSRDARQKLVFRVEARPDGEALRLNVGQPIDVRLQGNEPAT